MGIVRVEGVFEKGDVIEIKNETKKKLGFGIAQYDSQKPMILSAKVIRALVHYVYVSRIGANLRHFIISLQNGGGVARALLFLYLF